MMPMVNRVKVSIFFRGLMLRFHPRMNTLFFRDRQGQSIIEYVLLLTTFIFFATVLALIVDSLRPTMAAANGFIRGASHYAEAPRDWPQR